MLYKSKRPRKGKPLRRPTPEVKLHGIVLCRLTFQALLLEGTVPPTQEKYIIKHMAVSYKVYIFT